MNKVQLNKDLLEWFRASKRQLPWRETSDPFKIWMSEVMLQQTQVKTVIPYYNHFVRKYPTIDAVANAEEVSLLKDWEGLGYYNRIRNFHFASKEVQAKYNSIVPEDPQEFQSLRGVGPYIEGAVMSIAFNHKIAAVDGNVMRVYSRLHRYGEDISKQKTIKAIKADIESWMSDDAGDFNEAMMELGAMICTPKAPKCIICPIKSYCVGYEHNEVLNYPVKAKQKPKKEKIYNVFIIQNQHGDFYLVEQKDDLLKGMYEFPKYDIDTSIENIEEALNVEFTSQPIYLSQVKHVFTHKTWILEAYIIHTNDSNEHFKSIDEIQSLPMSKGMQKVLVLLDA